MPDTSPPPEKPVLVYDGDCRFCRTWVERWKSQTGERVAYRPFQDVGETFHGVTQKQFARAVCFISKDGSAFFFGAEAVFRLRADGMGKKTSLWCYRRVPGFKQVTEAAYRFIAAHRGIAYRFTKLCWGDPIPLSSFRVSSNIGIRLVGLVFLISFWSLRDQIVLLVGSGGLLPFHTALDAFRAKAGVSAYWLAPTLTWMNGSDQFLRALCTAGMVASVFVILDILTAPALLVCYACYLSLFTVGQEFMAYQWDLLLLESGFLAIWLAFARRFKPASSDPFEWIAWLFRWLVFRLFFFSGLVKILSGDASWRNLTALSYHYETQPLPTPLAWYAFHLPMWFQQVSTFSALAIELIVPFFIFAPRRLRHWAAFILIGFQVLIALTGNYGFFNLLTIVLCLFLLDDAWFQRFTPKRIFNWLQKKTPKRAASKNVRTLLASVAAIIIALSIVPFASLIVPDVRTIVQPVVSKITPFAVANQYGLFAVMTQHRLEVVIEGSDDGLLWKQYPFAYKPGDDLNKAPPFVFPYMPRLDWQMWFAPFASYQNNAWFQPLMTELLNGKGFARFLFASNPFPKKPPTYVRAMLYEYHFSPTHEGGAWWTRELKGYYFPPVTLNDLQTL